MNVYSTTYTSAFHLWKYTDYAVKFVRITTTSKALLPLKWGNRYMYIRHIHQYKVDVTFLRKSVTSKVFTLYDLLRTHVNKSNTYTKSMHGHRRRTKKLVMYYNKIMIFQSYLPDHSILPFFWIFGCILRTLLLLSGKLVFCPTIKWSVLNGIYKS